MAFIKRQQNSMGFTFSKHQNVNSNRQVDEPSINQKVNVNPQASEPSIQNVNFDENNGKQITEAGFQEDENVNMENDTSIKQEQFVNTSNLPIDGLNTKTSKTQFKPKPLIEEKAYTYVPCKWINQLYERFNERENEEKFTFPATAFRDKLKQVKWVSIHYRSLLECVLTISEIKSIAWNDLAELTNAFTFLITTTYFKELPDNYPFTKNIISLKDKLKGFCLKTQGAELVQFRLKFDTKKELLLHRFELSTAFPKLSFKQLQVNFKNEQAIQSSKTKQGR